MTFTSIGFILFFLVVAIAYYLIPNRFRWILLLLAGCIFYGSFAPGYLLLVVGIILVSYIGALWIDKNSGKSRPLILAFGIVLLLLPLLIFKYLDFFQGNLLVLAGLIDWNYPGHLLKLILPLGLSFYTFQAVAYLIEVYWKKQTPEKHLGIYSVFILFFPQLLAGPIARPQSLLPQFKADHPFNPEHVTEGLKLILWGFFKKLVLADRLALAVNYVYSHAPNTSGWTWIIAAIFFSFQIYCDFSAYSDIALGTARVLGFKLMENFKRPYFSKSIGEFWNRWHISLSSWLRDYIYIPLGGSRGRKWKWVGNVLITFLASGLWHGANWTFVFWGFLNGSYLIISKLTEAPRKWAVNLARLNNHPLLLRLIRVVFTFSLVTFSWIFFRSDSIGQAFVIFQKIGRDAMGWLASPVWPGLAGVRALMAQMGIGLYDLAIILGGLIVLESIELLGRKEGAQRLLTSQPRWIRWAVYYALILAIAFFGAYHGQGEFIYFKF